MPNIKAGGRVFRDVQKMNMEQLQEVRVALVKEQQKLVTSVQQQKLAENPSLANRGKLSQMDNAMQQLEHRLKMVDGFAKQTIKKAIPEVPKHYLDKQEGAADE
jgi:ATP-dependent exoDNAse (exonuclease V) alpha subunit